MNSTKLIICLLGSVLSVLHIKGATENFETLKRTLDTAIENVEKFRSSRDIKATLSIPLEDIRRTAFKALLVTFSDTCIPAGSGKTLMQNRLRLLDTSLSAYASSLSALIKKKEIKNDQQAGAYSLEALKKELSEILYWKDFIHTPLLGGN